MSKKENGEYSFNDPPQKTEIKVDKKLYIRDEIGYDEFLIDIKSKLAKSEMAIYTMKLKQAIYKTAIELGARRIKNVILSPE